MKLVWKSSLDASDIMKIGFFSRSSIRLSSFGSRFLFIVLFILTVFLKIKQQKYIIVSSEAKIFIDALFSVRTMAEDLERGQWDMLVAPCGDSIYEVLENNVYVCTYAKRHGSVRKPPRSTKYFGLYKNKKIIAVYEIDGLVNVKRDSKQEFEGKVSRNKNILEKDALDRAGKFMENNRIGAFDREEYLLEEYGMNLLLLSSKEETDCICENAIQGPVYWEDVATGLKPNTAKNLAEKIRGKVFREGELMDS